ncbi:O-antigen ligase family protein [Pseudonocardia sp.]|uniref:O-antigen ligase family protein n=1 Tax=Pseudonocardia sp. TaxID=60912 RepID=UPI00262FE695|nr:O-antigen ligase family protein [Pseudonocardia sp.]
MTAPGVRGDGDPASAWGTVTVAGARAEPTPPPPRLIGMVWGLMLVNTLGFTSLDLIIPFPHQFGQVITMAALALAFGLALVLNPRIRLRPNAYLLLLTLIVIVSVASSLQMESGTGSLLRCMRLILFVCTLWLLTAWWRGDLTFVRHHIKALCLILLTVVAGLIISPGSAFSGPGGRLVGAIWPIPAPQVGMYSAVAIGLCVLLWTTRRLDGRSAVLVTVPAVALLLLSHTRTALLGLVVGLAVAGLSLVLTTVRARRTLLGAVAAGVVGLAVFGQTIEEWLARGQKTEDLANLTGRTKVWDELLAKHRTVSEEAFGVGLTDKSFGGLPIDNAWLTIYNEQGWIGITLVAGFLLTMLVAAMLRPSSPQRACALFIVIYCITVSYTEGGLGDASPYLLALAVAASLLATPVSAAAQSRSVPR